MRVDLAGVTRRQPGFGFTFDGRAVTGYAGETLAAALIAAGELELRETRSGGRRGVFCGMGMCGECTVLVGGQSHRACMTAAASDLVVETLPARVAATGVRPVFAEVRTFACDLLIVGAGPAGLAAARTATAAGLSVIVADERSKPGGQYYKQPGHGLDVDESAIDHQFAEGRALARAVAATSVQLLSECLIWSASIEAGVIRAEATLAAGPARIDARRIIIATGAAERPWPVPGWTLPGVMTTGAAQTLLRSGAVAPGRRVLVAGNGPLNLQLATELVAAGVDVVAVIEQAGRPGPSAVSAALAMLATDARLVATGLDQLLRLHRADVPVLYGHVLTRIEGQDRAERVTVAPVGADGTLGAAVRAFAVDAVCIGAGFQPQADLARALGCAMTWHDGAAAVVRDDVGRTNLCQLFVAGDGGGLGGARAALAQGALAGLAAARDLVGLLPDGLRKLEAAEHRALTRARRFQAGLWRLFAPRRLSEPLTAPDTPICRCEDVNFGTVDALIAEGARDAGSIKRATRLGMGRCQGRYCGPLLAQRLASAAGRDATETDLFAPRPPFKPVSVAQLAASAPPR